MVLIGASLTGITKGSPDPDLAGRLSLPNRARLWALPAQNFSELMFVLDLRV
jgi:hypothetical protein